MLIKDKRLVLVVGLIILNLVAGCSEKYFMEEGVCEANFSSEEDLPKSVLVGVDVVNIESLPANVGRLGSNYSAEIGGATLALSIVIDSKILNIKRTFREPGESAHTRVYESICVSNGILRGQNLIGRVVKDGILLLERKPNIDGVPVDLWVFYDKNN